MRLLPVRRGRHDHSGLRQLRAVAIVNANARRLGGRLRRRLEQALPGGVRYTHSLDDARGAIRDEVRRGVDVLVLGGGDGTFVMGLSLLAEAMRAPGTREPAVGVLRLGTGNAIASALGAGRDVAGDLARLARGAGRRRELPLLEVLGVRAPFVGMGIDAQLLEDHAAVGELIDRVPGSRFVGSRARYAMSVALRTVPRFALASRPHVVVTNTGASAIELDANGATGRRIAAGKELWRGACTMVAGSTTPYFGFGMKMFAFGGEHAGRFHLRCGDASLLEMLRSAPAVFRGDYWSDRVHDFACDRVEIALDREAAIEAGGELLGRRSRVELALGRSITVVTLDRSSKTD